jgi:hypothetical protein
MALFLSLLSLGCFAGAGTTFLRYDGRYFELLIMCGVVTMAAAEIISAFERRSQDSIRSVRRAQTPFTNSRRSTTVW